MNNIQFKVFLGFFLSFIVIFSSLLFTIVYLDLRRSPVQEEVLGEPSQVHVEEETVPIQEDILESFMQKFGNKRYRVEDSGSFGYIYDELEDGIISLDEGDEDTYFENGKLVYFDAKEDMSVLWQNDVKHILFKKTEEYYVVTNSSEFYFRNYLGQHILQDFVDEYAKNKDFITKKDEHTWLWEWDFFTPVDQSQKHSMRAEVVFDQEQNYIEKIMLFDEEEDEICTFEFVFEEVESFDFKRLMGSYERVYEVTSP